MGAAELPAVAIVYFLLLCNTFIAQGTTKVNSALFNIWRGPVYRQLMSSIGFSKEFRSMFQESASEFEMCTGYSSSDAVHRSQNLEPGL